MTKKLLILSSLIAVSPTSQAVTLSYDSFFSGMSGTVKLNGTARTLGIGKQLFKETGSSIFTVSATLDANPSTVAPYAIVTTPNNTTKVGLAGRIVANNFAKVGTDTVKSAGLQLAVWEALYDGGSSFSASAGRFQLNDPSLSGAVSYAQTIYNSAFTQSGQARYYINSTIRGQSQIAAVPEPASMLALGVGLAGMLRRRKLRAA